MRVVYMGTPDFAVGALQSIIDAGHEVVLVCTQPDREKGRGKEVSFSPVKECAIANGIPVFQPNRIKEAEAVAHLKEYEADVYVVAAFGQILSKEILDIPPMGCINIHASLLPKYRGSSPIQWAILNGDEKTGVTIMKMDEGVDTGDILLQREITIDRKETGNSLFDRLADLGAEVIVEALEGLKNNSITPIPQDDAHSTHVGMLTKEMGNIDWNKPAEVIERYVRGLNSWPSAYSHIGGKTMKIWASDIVSDGDAIYDSNGTHRPGEVVAVNKGSFDVMCDKSVLRITEVQLEGKKRMDVDSFLRGYDLKVGDRFE